METGRTKKQGHSHKQGKSQDNPAQPYDPDLRTQAAISLPRQRMITHSCTRLWKKKHYILPTVELLHTTASWFDSRLARPEGDVGPWSENGYDWVREPQPMRGPASCTRATTNATLSARP